MSTHEISNNNTVRIHSHCGYLSPNEYEEQYLKNLETDVTNLAS